MYTDKTAVENYISKTIATEFNSQLDEWIAAMSLEMDNMSNCKLVADQPEESGADQQVEFSYDGDGTDTLLIKTCTEISAVIIDDTERDDFVAYPANKDFKNKIRLPSGVFTRGLQNIGVTAIQAKFKTLPADIKFACTVLVAGIINNQITGAKNATSERIGNYTVTYDNEQGQKDFERAKRTISSHKVLTL